MQTWQLQKAKAHLSDLVREAAMGKPQEITFRGKPAVVVLSTECYEKLIHAKPTLVSFLRDSPLLGLTVDIVRDKSSARDIDL